jgi:DNA-directed RNA polymerase specialized sigma24 family protein
MFANRSEGLTGTRRRYRIRAIFARKARDHGINSAMRLLGMRAVTLNDKAAREDFEVSRNPDGSYFLTWTQLAYAAMQQWPLSVIFEELGKDAERVMPDLLRPQRAVFNLPEYQGLMIAALARRSGVDPDTFLSDHLLDLAAVHAAELEDEIPGFREALMFPDPVRSDGK